MNSNHVCGPLCSPTDNSRGMPSLADLEADAGTTHEKLVAEQDTAFRELVDVLRPGLASFADRRRGEWKPQMEPVMVESPQREISSVLEREAPRRGETMEAFAKVQSWGTRENFLLDETKSELGASWKKEPLTVSFQTKQPAGFSTASPQPSENVETLPPGSRITITDKDGYVLKEWVTNGD